MAHLGKYEITGELGRGGFATVYKARDTELDRLVALKVLHPYWSEDPSFVARFRQEARTAARLRHPNIVTIHDAGEIDGQLYIAMECLIGRTLRELLAAEGALTLEQALAILEQLAQALDYAHRQGVVHRDVKPGNVMVGETADHVRVTLTDFGLVKAMSASTALTSQGTLLGSPEYMAPEQADPGRRDEIGPATDRYALGVVAYQMLTGQVPFPGNTPATLNAHLSLSPPDPQSLRVDLPASVCQVLSKALSKSPGERYPTAMAMVDALRQAGARELRKVREPQARRAGPPALLWGLAAIPVLVLLAAILVLALLSGTLWLGKQSGGGSLVRGAPTRAPTLSPTTRATAVTTPTPTDASLPAPTDRLIETPTTRTTAAPTITTVPTEKATVPPTIKPASTPIRLPTSTPTHSPTPTSTRPPTSTPVPTVTPTLAPEAGATRVREKDGAVMVYVPAGEFWMGSTDEDIDAVLAGCWGCRRESFAFEQPQHEVPVDAFWIDRTEVTNAQYRQCVEAGVCSPPAKSSSDIRENYYGNSEYDDYPVIFLSWYQARKYAEWVGGRLPTEAEWEYACRGPGGSIYPWGDDPPPDHTLLNYKRRIGDGDTTAIGSYPDGASWIGALDMAGNVWEWTQSLHKGYPYDPADGREELSAGGSRVVRGGGSAAPSTLFVARFVAALIPIATGTFLVFVLFPSSLHNLASGPSALCSLTCASGASAHCPLSDRGHHAAQGAR
jgi:serine/threonine-protein kinase